MASPVSISTELTYLRVRGILGYFVLASERYGIPLVLLLAVASRESNMGLGLDANWTGDHGYGIGIMQIDKRYHPGFTETHPNNDHQANINYGAQFLADLINVFNGEFRSAIAAYNAGETRVRNALRARLDPDQVTTGGDYSRDVLHRMEVIQSVMGLTKASSVAVYLLPAGLVGLATYNYLKTPSS